MRLQTQSSSLPPLLQGSSLPCPLGTAAGSAGNIQVPLEPQAKGRLLFVAFLVLLCSVLRELLLQSRAHENLLKHGRQDETPLTS